MFLLVLLSFSAVASAHQTKAVGDDEFLVIVGFVSEPIYTDVRNGLDLLIRRADNGEPVEHLESTMFVEIVAPDGETTRMMPLRAQYNQPGRYTSDIVLTEPGQYHVRIWGYIQHVEFDETFHLHDVTALSELRFP